MPESPCCSKCGALLPADAPAGLCPKCLVQAGFESEKAQQPSVGSGDPAVQPTLKSPAHSGAGFEPPSPAELAPLFPQLEILELLGKGGMGAVYKARQRGLDRLVAVKILPPEIGHDAAFAERFTREARALARLNHPHIVAVYDFGQTPSPQPSPQGGEGILSSPLAPPLHQPGRGAGGERSLFYIVMEYVDGVNLRQTIQTGGLTPQSALAIVPQICEALQFAHDEGIVHRDIKPENILIDKKGRVKIADFGLAKLTGQDSRENLLTGTHQVMGTLRYMAPEQMQGSREVDHRADIYSLGVVFYELLTGELPLGRFAPPSKKVQVDVRLDEVVLRALEQDPEQRYQHASQIKTDVETVTGSPAAPPASPAAPDHERGNDLLLDEIDRSARTLQHFALLGGLSLLALGILLVPMSPPFIPLAVVMGAGGIGLLIVAGRTKQQWEVEYCGHSVRFENSVFTSGCLMIDGKIVALGGIGMRTELSGRIPRGLGAGDRIVAMTWAGFLSFRCRLVVQRQISSALKQNEIWPSVAIAARGESTSFTTAGDAAPPPNRPKLVPVLAAANLVGAIVLMLFSAMEETTTFSESVSSIWQMWGQVDAVLTFVVSAGLFAASVGLLLWKPWARKVTLGVCIFGLASLVFDAPYLARGALPELYSEIQKSLIAEGVSPDVLDFAAMSTFVGVFGGMLLVGLVWLIGQLVYFTRPRIIAAFEGAGVVTPSVTSPARNAPAVLGVRRRVPIAVWILLAGFFSILFFCGVLYIVDWTHRPASDSTAIAPAQQESASGNPAAESSSGWVMAPNGPELTDGFAQAVLKLRPEKVEAVNVALQEAHRKYLTLEQEHSARDINDAGRVVTTIRPFPGPLSKLEDHLWSQLDAILDSSQQSIARLNLHLHPRPVQPPMALNEIVAPGFFGWGKEGAKIEIWRVGTWFHWQVSTRGYADAEQRQAQLPDELHRFWKDAISDEGRIQGIWKYLASMRDGQITAPEELASWNVTFVKGQYTEQPADRFEKGTYKLDPMKSPKTIDCLLTEGPHKGLPVAGIYEWDGDTLKICWAHWGSLQHPQEFSAAPGSQRALIVLKRADAAVVPEN